jgi:hypothetical protein
METGNFSSVMVGWAAIITGSSAILAVIFLALMYTVKRSLGYINDIFNSLIGISSAILAFLLYVEFQSGSASLSQIALGLVVVGAIFTIVGTVLSVARITDFVMAGWYTGIGNALLGLWLVNYCYSMLGSDVLPQSLPVFGLVVGAFMALGLIGILGIITKVDKLESMPKYLYVAFFCYMGTYFLYPIWTIQVGRYFLLK